MRVTFHTHADTYERAAIGAAVPPAGAIDRFRHEVQHDGFLHAGGGVVRVNGVLVGTFDDDGFHPEPFGEYRTVAQWVARTAGLPAADCRLCGGCECAATCDGPARCECSCHLDERAAYRALCEEGAVKLRAVLGDGWKVEA